MTTQTIEVEGLPKGYEVNSITVNAKENVSQCFNTVQATIHLKKIQPKRVVLEEVEHGTHEVAFHNDDGCWTYWRYVKENDLSLTNEEPKLSLSVAQCKKFFNGTITGRLEVFQLVEDFIKDK